MLYIFQWGAENLTRGSRGRGQPEWRCPAVCLCALLGPSLVPSQHRTAQVNTAINSQANTATNSSSGCTISRANMAVSSNSCWAFELKNTNTTDKKQTTDEHCIIIYMVFQCLNKKLLNCYLYLSWILKRMHGLTCLKRATKGVKTSFSTMSWHTSNPPSTVMFLQM